MIRRALTGVLELLAAGGWLVLVVLVGMVLGGVFLGGGGR